MKVVGRWRRARRPRGAEPGGTTVRVTLGGPLDGTGGDPDPSALAMISGVGCLSTILILLARRRRLDLESLSVTLDDGGGSGGEGERRGVIRIRSDEDPEALEEAVRLAERSCPPELLRTRSGDELEVEVQVEKLSRPLRGASRSGPGSPRGARRGTRPAPGQDP